MTRGSLLPGLSERVNKLRISQDLHRLLERYQVVLGYQDCRCASVAGYRETLVLALDPIHHLGQVGLGLGEWDALHLVRSLTPLELGQAARRKRLELHAFLVRVEGHLEVIEEAGQAQQAKGRDPGIAEPDWSLPRMCVASV